MKKRLTGILDSPSTLFMLLGSIFAFLGVALGAFGAHALRTSLDSNALDVYETAVR